MLSVQSAPWRWQKGLGVVWVIHRLSVTGIAGPGGATPDKPVGLVYIALASEDGTSCSKFNFDGDRKENKKRSSDEALEMLHEYLMQ